MKCLCWLLALIGVFGCCGCSSLHHLTSTPPTPSITLAGPVTEKFLGGQTILPAGKYAAKLEDNQGYYYQAPEKLLSNNTVAFVFDGGLYWPKGASAPTCYYIIQRDGQLARYKLRSSPSWQLHPQATP